LFRHRYAAGNLLRESEAQRKLTAIIFSLMDTTLGRATMSVRRSPIGASVIVSILGLIAGMVIVRVSLS